MKFPSFIKYMDTPLSRGFMALYTSRTILIIAGGLLGLFIPIFLYELFDRNFQYVILLYGSIHLLYIITAPQAMHILNRCGFRNALRFSSFIGAFIYLLYYFLDKETMLVIIPLIIISGVLFKWFYWLPYHVDFTKFTDTAHRGRQVSILESTRLLLSVFLPIVGAFIIEQFGFDVLFIIAIGLFLVSALPYRLLPKISEIYSWNYRQTWKQLFSRRNSKVLLAYSADGAESVISIIVWPIFIFEILDGNYLQVGALSTLVIGTTIILQLSLGKYIDTKVKKESVLKFGSVFYAIGWVIKIFIATAFEIFVAGLYHNIVKIFMRTPFDTITYEISADQGHYIDEFTVLKEMAIHIGRFIMVLLVIGISLVLSLKWVFLLAVVASLTLTAIRAKDIHLNARVLQ